MESIKHGNSETSGEENGHPSSPEKSIEEHKSGTGRSYECTFCKRGFTNAQALGGHMNIHRKDKVKAKAEKNLTKSKKKDYMINNSPPSSYFTKISSDDQQGNYYHNSSSFGGQMNYQSFYPPSNPSYPQGYNCHYASGYCGGQRAEQFGVYDESHLGANLSIGIGAADMESSSGRGKGRDGNEDWLENEIDLELRLGQYP